MLARRATGTAIAVLTAIVIVMLALFVLVRSGAATAVAQTPEPGPGVTAVPRSVSVAGHGEVRAAPDQASIAIGVESQAATADAALDENNARMAALLKVLKDAGIASKDIQTSNFSIFPVYEERPSANGTLQVTGYRVANQVTVTVHALDRLGPLLDAVVKAGANQIHGISFGFSNPQALLDQARERAMGDAQRKASQLATLGEATLGQVITISEGGAVPPPVVMEARAVVADAAAVPVEAGEAAVTVDVQVTYALR